MALVETSIRRPVTVVTFALAAVVFGVVAFRQLATDLLPDITYPSLTVRTTYPGAAPIEVESLVTRPVENAVGVVNGLVRVSSSSRTGISEVTLELGWGTNMDFAALDVRERLDVVRLPLDVDQPLLLRYDPSLDPILRVGITGDDDLVRLRRLAEERVQRPLERIGGVAAAQIQGGLEEEVQIEVDERQLAAQGLDIDLLAARLAQENVNLTGGRLRDAQAEYLVRTVGELERPEELEELVISSSDGALVRLRDVATVRRGHREREIITRIDGRESVEVAVYKAGGTNTVNVSRAVEAGLEEIRDQLGRVAPGVEITVVSDQARYISQAVSEVLQTALIGGLLAILVLFLFLRAWRPTLIIAAAIPISVVATFFLMFASGISLNIMSLGGLTLGVGLLVDNAIVVLESIQRRRDAGLGAEEAARAGAGEVSRAIVASTITSICVFLPIVFVEGVAAQLFTDQALTVTYSLLVSLVVALTVIPMLASRRLRRGEDASPPTRAIPRALFRAAVALGRALKAVLGALWWPISRLLAWPSRLFLAAFEKLSEIYGHLLDGALRRPLVTLFLALLAFAGSLLIFPRLGQELVPELVQGEFYLAAELPPGTHLDVTQRRLGALERAARELEGVGTVYTLAGSAGQEGGVAGEQRENLGRMTLTVAPPFSRAKEERLMTDMRQVAAGDPELRARFGRPSYFSFETPIEIELRGYNLKLLRRYSEELVSRLSGTEGFADVESSAEGGYPELQIHFDRERLASLDLDLGDVADVVATKVQGVVATEIQREDRTIDIRLRAAEGYRDSAADLRNLIVYQQGRTTLPLSAVAEVVEAEGPAEIRRADGERVALVTANLAGLDMATASRVIEGIMDDLRLPGSFDWRLGGQRKEMQTSFDSMRLALALAIFLVYLVMASQFESLIHPFVILFSVPLALIGVLLVLFAFEVRISVVVLIGVVLLAGIVVNNAIILVDTANRLRREGRSKLEALRRAGRIRLRPICMTTATTVLGLLPMAIGLGEGSELRAPMALAVIGGLLSSTVLTLLVIPVVYSLVDRGE